MDDQPIEKMDKPTDFLRIYNAPGLGDLAAEFAAMDASEQRSWELAIAAKTCESLAVIAAYTDELSDAANNVGDDPQPRDCWVI